MPDLINKIREYFLNNPYNEIYLRELARKLKISPYAVKKHIDLLIKDGLIAEEKRANLRYFKGNISNIYFKQLKVALNIKNIIGFGLVDYLKREIPAISSIILFGSMAKGENDDKSDIDILVIGKHKELSLQNIEKKIGREVNVHLMSWNEWNKNYKNNGAFYYEVIIYGIPLLGELPIIK